MKFRLLYSQSVLREITVTVIRRTLILFALLCSGLAAEPSSPLKLVSDIWPPFTDIPGHQRTASDLVEQALKRSSIQSTTSVHQFDEALARIGRNEADAIIAAWDSETRRETFEMSAPYLENRMLLVSKDAGVTEISDLSAVDSPVSSITAYDYGDYNQHASLKRYPDTVASLRALLAGEVRYMLAEELVVKDIKSKLPARLSDSLHVSENAVLTRSVHFAVRKTHPKATEIIAAFDASIDAMVISGDYNRILGLDWIQVDVDNDGITEWVSSGVSDKSSLDDDDLALEGYPLHSLDVKFGRERFLVNGERYSTLPEARRALRESPERVELSVEPRSDFGIILKDF